MFLVNSRTIQYLYGRYRHWGELYFSQPIQIEHNIRCFSLRFESFTLCRVNPAIRSRQSAIGNHHHHRSISISKSLESSKYSNISQQFIPLLFHSLNSTRPRPRPSLSISLQSTGRMKVVAGCRVDRLLYFTAHLILSIRQLNLLYATITRFPSFFGPWMNEWMMQGREENEQKLLIIITTDQFQWVVNHHVRRFIALVFNRKRKKQKGSLLKCWAWKWWTWPRMDVTMYLFP